MHTVFFLTMGPPPLLFLLPRYACILLHRLFFHLAANSTARGLLGETYFSSSDSNFDDEGDEKDLSGVAGAKSDVPTEMTAAANIISEVEMLMPPREISFVTAEAQDENAAVDLEVNDVDSCLDALLEETLQKNRATKEATMGGDNVGSSSANNAEEDEKLRANRRKRAKLLSSHFKQQLEEQNIKS